MTNEQECYNGSNSDISTGAKTILKKKELYNKNHLMKNKKNDISLSTPLIYTNLLDVTSKVTRAKKEKIFNHRKKYLSLEVHKNIFPSMESDHSPKARLADKPKFVFPSKAFLKSAAPTTPVFGKKNVCTKAFLLPAHKFRTSLSTIKPNTSVTTTTMPITTDSTANSYAKSASSSKKPSKILIKQISVDHEKYIKNISSTKKKTKSTQNNSSNSVPSCLPKSPSSSKQVCKKLQKHYSADGLNRIKKG